MLNRQTISLFFQLMIIILMAFSSLMALLSDSGATHHSPSQSIELTQPSTPLIPSAITLPE